MEVLEVYGVADFSFGRCEEGRRVDWVDIGVGCGVKPVEEWGAYGDESLGVIVVVDVCCSCGGINDLDLVKDCEEDVVGFWGRALEDCVDEKWWDGDGVS